MSKELRLEVSTAEFLLDLPDGISIRGAKVDGGVLVLEVDTELDFPEVSTLIYQNDDFGNIALVGIE
jgi:hypothetical protein